MNMDLITTTPGLIHIAEQIFSNLDRYSLLICQKVNVYWASILQNPWFWFNRMMQNTTLSQVHQKEWMKFCENLSKLILTKDMIEPLALNYIYGQLEDSVTLNETYWFAICTSSEYSTFAEIVRIMAPLIENPNSLSEDGDTTICWAAQNGHAEIVKILAPLTNNPNAPNQYGSTPIFKAAWFGHTEIVKILAPLTDNPNAPNEYGYTPIHKAAYHGHTEIVKILAHLTDNPNAPDDNGDTPIHGAASNGHTEIVKILAPLTDDPDVPNNWGDTPRSLAQNDIIRGILVQFFL